MRKLASVQTILDILPHNNADTLEIAKILGWTCVVLKEQFQKGDKVVYIEPDAILPEGNPVWEFMRDRKFKIKTIRLRGVISQGLVFPLSILYPSNVSELSFLEEGMDVTERLGITKYEPYTPAQIAGQVKGNFPEFLYKTDETRIQAVPEVLNRHQGRLFYVTEKLDGTSATYYLNNGEFGVCSRNLELKEDDTNIYWKVARELDLKNKLIKLNGNFAIQGELVGQGIQKNKYSLSAVKLFLFNIFDIDKQKYLGYDDFLQVSRVLELEKVPMLSTLNLNHTVDELVKFAQDFSRLNPKIPREGIIWKPLVEQYDEDLGRLSFKIINPEFLLKYDE